MLSIFRDIIDTFWSEHIWLPPNTKWSDLKPKNSTEIDHTDSTHLLYPFPMAFVMLVCRYLLERYFFIPFGKRVGVKDRRGRRAYPNAILEEAYDFSNKPSAKECMALAKKVDMTERQVERWFRVRRIQDKPTDLAKFCENSFRCMYYVSAFVFGLIVLWRKPWFWDIKECWTDYPYQTISNDIWWYYMISMSFYWSLTVSQFFDNKRKDFWQMFLHHIVTIVLMAFSWLTNFHRIGTLVLLVHDCADGPLEAAKMAKYAGRKDISYILFGLFTVLWIITRIIIYPFWIIYSTGVEAPRLLPMFPCYYIFNSLLLILFLLHLFWTYLILRMLYTSLITGSIDKDIRSSSDYTSEVPSS